MKKTKKKKVWKQVVHQERQLEQKSEAKNQTVVARTTERMSPSHEICCLVAFDYLLVKTELIILLKSVSLVFNPESGDSCGLN